MDAPLILRRRGFDRLLCVARSRWPMLAIHDSSHRLALVEQMPLLVLVCTDHPDAFRSEAPRITALSPLSEVLVVTGSWARASGRTRSHWPIAWEISETAAIERIGDLASSRSSVRPRPKTWTRDEAFLESVGMKK